MSEWDRPTTMFVLSRRSEHPFPLAPHELPEAPRPVEFTLVSKVYRGIALVAFLVVPNAILYFGLAIVQPLRDLEADGQATEAVVTSRYTTRGNRGSTNYWVQFRYTVDAKPYNKEMSASAQDFARLREGDAVEVTYLPADPNNYCVGKPGDHAGRQIRLVFLWAVGTALALAVVFLYLHISMSRELYLARNGVAILGQITGKEAIRRKNGFTYSVHYAFEPEGLPLRYGTKTLAMDVWLYLCVGLRVTVLYLPENPGRFQLLFGFDHVRFLAAAPDEEAECGLLE
jgi:hypothetical protein